MPIRTRYGEDDSMNGHVDHAQLVAQLEVGIEPEKFVESVLTTLPAGRDMRRTIFSPVATHWPKVTSVQTRIVVYKDGIY